MPPTAQFLMYISANNFSTKWPRNNYFFSLLIKCTLWLQFPPYILHLIRLKFESDNLKMKLVTVCIFCSINTVIPATCFRSLSLQRWINTHLPPVTHSSHSRWLSSVGVTVPEFQCVVAVIVHNFTHYRGCRAHTIKLPLKDLRIPNWVAYHD